MTAAHAITGRTPIREEDWRDPKVKVVARTPKGELLRYQPFLCGITMVFNDALHQSLEIDLAVLRPAEPLLGVEHLEISHERWPPVGTRVLMAGFPDELETPLLLSKTLVFEPQGSSETADETRRFIEQISRPRMIKSGMVGHRSALTFGQVEGWSEALDVGVYYVDNAMHSGSSGGPVVDERGLVIGVISKRAVTVMSLPELKKPNIEVPSGSALAISAFTALEFIAAGA